MRNLQEQVKKAFCYQKLFWPFTVWINYFSDLKIFANFQPSASNFKKFSRSLEHFCLTVGQNNFGNKIPFLNSLKKPKKSSIFIAWYTRIEDFCSFFGRIENKKICFLDLLTFMHHQFFFLIFGPLFLLEKMMSFMDDPKDDGQKSSLPHRYSLAVLFCHFISGHSLVASDWHQAHTPLNLSFHRRYRLPGFQVCTLRLTQWYIPRSFELKFGTVHNRRRLWGEGKLIT